MTAKQDHRAAADAEYRRMLGLEPDQKFPAVLGQADSAGGARGGRGNRHLDLLQKRRIQAANRRKQAQVEARRKKAARRGLTI